MPPLLLRHRLVLFLVALLVAASSHGDAAAYDASKCLLQSYTCGGVSISYPFYYADKTGVVNGSSDSYCGYPGMAIKCDDDKAPVVELNGEKYRVTAINYSNLTVSLADPDALKPAICPRVDHNVTVPLSPVSWSWLHLPASNIIDYLVLFLDCSLTTALGALQLPTGYRITCQGFGPAGLSSFVLPKDQVPQGNWSHWCPKIVEVPVLKYGLYGSFKSNEPGWGSDGYAGFLRRGFQLVWQSTPDQCSRCERSSGGRCAYNGAGGFVACLCPDGRVNKTVCSARSRKSHSIIIGAVVAGGVSALLIAGAVAIVFIRKRKQKKVTSSSKLLKYSGSGGTPRSRVGDDEESGGFQDPKTHLFSYEELEEATDSFNDSRELGDGGFGTVYKGYLRDGRVVAVKRLYNNNYRRVEQFVNEAAILSRLRHPNLVMFYGCTSSHSRELLLVYEFVPNGTVADHLHGHRAAESALTWPLRLKIAVESAAALTYLHAVDQPIVHRDVKTTNILLDADFHVKVADFGLSRLFPLDATHVSTAPQGTPGYVDPEYHQCYQLTDKSDVYSFGVVLVELISSKPAVDITRQRNEINLAGMAISKIQKCKLEELVDVGLGYDSDPETRRMMTMVAELAFRCLQQNGEMRPPIKEVLEVLRGIQDGSGSDKHNKDTDALVAPFSPDTVHAPWESRSTTPNTSQ